MALDPKRQQFVDEFLCSLNLRQAAIAAGWPKKTTHADAQRLVDEDPEVFKAIQEGFEKRKEQYGIKQEDIIRHWWELANLDMNELVEFRRNNCRYCHGIGHEYQYTVVEYLKAKRRDPDLPEHPAGGYGFKPSARPNPDCPECGGDGVEQLFIKDSRDLTGVARKAYGGVKLSRNGMELVASNRESAMENVAKHFGMFPELFQVSGPNGGPIQQQVVLSPEDSYKKMLDG